MPQDKHSVTKSGPWGAPYRLENYRLSTDTLSSLLFTELCSEGFGSSVVLEISLAQMVNHKVSKSKQDKQPLSPPIMLMLL